MKKLLRAAVTLFIFAATPGFAADMPVKAPLRPPAPVYSWTGWYVGGNIGGSWGDAHTDVAGSGILGFIGTEGSFAFADSSRQQLNGLIGGGQIGFNYQVSPQWVLGWEADIQGSGERGSASFSDPFSAVTCGPPCVAVGGTATTSDQGKIEWFGTVRGRVGVLINDGLLLYSSGGLAYGRVGVSGNVNISAATLPPNAGVFWGPTADGFSESTNHVGYAVGGGLEGRLPASLPPNWTWKLEYLYVDLGSIDTSTTFVAATNAPGSFSPLAGTMTTHTHFTDNIVRVGLNYQLH